MKKCMTWLMAALCSVAVAAPAMAADTIKIGVQGAHSGDLARSEERRVGKECTS